MPEVIPQTISNEHVLGAALMFQHPVSGYRYYGVCEKRNGTNQDFVVYRRAENSTTFEFVYALDGQGRDASSQVTMGGGLITRNGSLEVWASGDAVDVDDNSGTGFDAIGAIVPGIDLPWAFPAAVKAAQTPSHIRLNPPEGYKPYGANQSFVVSAEVVDGLPVYFFAQEGWGYSTDNKGFGEYVFKQVGNRRAEYVRYNGADVPDGRGDLYTPGNGKLYITGNESDSDKGLSVYEVPGYVPFGNVVYINSGAAAAGGSDPQLAQKVTNLESQLNDVQAQAKAALDRANYVKSVFDPVWEVLTALGNRPVSISRDEAWVLAQQAVYAELGHPQSGISGRVSLLAGSSNVDAQARQDIAAVKQSIPALIAQGITDWLNASVAYAADTRLLNLIWDRTVKLLRYKEQTGKTAAQLGINDPKNIAK